MSFLISSSHLFFRLPSGRVNIGFHLYTFLPFFLPAFVVNGQTSLIFVLLCDTRIAQAKEILCNLHKGIRVTKLVYVGATI